MSILYQIISGVLFGIGVMLVFIIYQNTTTDSVEVTVALIFIASGVFAIAGSLA